MAKTPEQVVKIIDYLRKHRKSAKPFDIALTGCSKPREGRRVGEYAVAGVTWWLESIHGYRETFEELKKRMMGEPA